MSGLVEAYRARGPRHGRIVGDRARVASGLSAASAGRQREGERGRRENAQSGPKHGEGYATAGVVPPATCVTFRAAMLDLPDPGLYRTTQALPGHESDMPAGVLVYLGQDPNTGAKFVVRPGRNEKNRWFWGEPTTPLRSPTWAKTLRRLPPEGFYTLPETIELESGGRWLQNAIVQLGYNGEGKGIIFVGEQHDGDERNVLNFSDKGMMVDDNMLERLVWAPILPVPKS